MQAAKVKSVQNKLRENTFNDIISMLHLAKKHQNNFAIYGAGNIGEKVLEILSLFNLRPVCIFDKQYQSIQEINDTPVKKS